MAQTILLLAMAFTWAHEKPQTKQCQCAETEIWLLLNSHNPQVQDKTTKKQQQKTPV